MKIDNIRKLQPNEIQQLHKECIQRDFPKNEVRPYKMVKRLVNKKLYVVYGAFSNNTLISYATFFSLPNNPVVLLDYLAVQPQYRGTGIGTEFFKNFKDIVKAEFPNAKVIVIECEDPSYATNYNDKIAREKRIRFYTQNGALLTENRFFAFGVNYNLLSVYFDSNKPKLNLGKSVYDLYLYSFNRIFRILVKNNLKYFDAHMS